MLDLNIPLSIFYALRKKLPGMRMQEAQLQKSPSFHLLQAILPLRSLFKYQLYFC